MSNIHLRKASHSDCYFFYQIRNHPQNRLNSTDSVEIDYPNHQAWFQMKISDPNNHYFVIDDGELALGYIRLDQNCLMKEVSIALAPIFQGKGIGKKALMLVTKWTQEKSLGPLLALVKNTNLGSIKIFSSVGFKIQAESENALITFIFN